LRRHLVLIIAKGWPDDRPNIDAGTLVIERETPQADGDCRDINYDPTILPAGPRPSDDPALAARSSAYAVSYNRRTREEAHGPASAQASTRNIQ
jgi:catalase